MTPDTGEKVVSFRRLIGVGISSKLLIDIGNQIFNPFLPVIASGLGLDVIQLGRLVGLRSAMGVFAPFFGAAADRTSYRRVIRFALILNALGFVLVGTSQANWMTVSGMILAGLGATSFVPTLQAYVSARLSYSIRARGLGMIEYSWALTGILGLSLVGVLIQATSWRVPFLILAAAMVGMSFVFGRMPASARQRLVSTESGRQSDRGVRKRFAYFHLGNNARSAYATMVAGALSYLAAMQILIAHGTWLVQQYGLDPAMLGLVAFVFGLFDLVASVSVSLFTDRIGKRRSVLIGIVGSWVGYLLLPFLNSAVVVTVLALGITRMFFEFNIVSHFPLLSEQVPAQRGKTMTLGSAFALAGGTVAGFTGPWLLVTYGVQALTWSSAAIVSLALVIVLTLVREAPVELERAPIITKP